MSILISQTIDPEELIKQYNWLCEQSSAGWVIAPDSSVVRQDTTPDEVIGLQNLLESLMMRMWGNTHIYQDTQRYQEEDNPLYLVIMPDSHTTCMMQCNEHGTFFACVEGPAEGDLTWTQLDNGDMVPVGFMKEVSIISVEPVIREHVLQYISEDLEHYEQYLEPPT